MKRNATINHDRNAHRSMALGLFRIRLAVMGDVLLCQRISRQFRSELPFVSLPQLQGALELKALHVAELDEQVVGFVRFRRRRDGVSVIYDLAVDSSVQGMGIGRALLYSVPCPLFLKCKADNERGNHFYERAGMYRVGNEVTPRDTELIHWKRDILHIVVQGGNDSIPDLAHQAGAAYGTRHTDKPADWPFALDILWENYDWKDYMHKVCTWRPVQALAADYEHPSQRRLLYRQIRDLKAAGVLRIAVCPKFAGAVAHIPSWCIVAVSIESDYSGFEPAIDELAGRRVHLLGGAPTRWFGQRGRPGLIKVYKDNGVKVISLDGNSASRAAGKGSTWSQGRWFRDSNPVAGRYDLFAGMTWKAITQQLNTLSAVEMQPMALEYAT
jgi:Acetyltransferases